MSKEIEALQAENDKLRAGSMDLCERLNETANALSTATAERSSLYARLETMTTDHAATCEARLIKEVSAHDDHQQAERSEG